MIFALLFACTLTTPEPAVTPDPPPPAVDAETIPDAEVSVRLTGVNRVTYHYGDASVPPPDHRSVTISVSGTEVSREVDSYGEIIESSSRPGTGKDLGDAIRAFKAAGLALSTAGEGPQCTGGTTETVRLHAKDEVRFEGTVLHCGGADTGTLTGDVAAFRAAMEALAATP
jgi:hypothetical protein